MRVNSIELTTVVDEEYIAIPAHTRHHHGSDEERRVSDSAQRQRVTEPLDRADKPNFMWRRLVREYGIYKGNVVPVGPFRRSIDDGEPPTVGVCRPESAGVIAEKAVARLELVSGHIFSSMVNHREIVARGHLDHVFKFRALSHFVELIKMRRSERQMSD